MITKEDLGPFLLNENVEKLLAERDEAYRKAIENDAEIRKSWYKAEALALAYKEIAHDLVERREWFKAKVDRYRENNVSSEELSAIKKQLDEAAELSASRLLSKRKP